MSYSEQARPCRASHLSSRSYCTYYAQGRVRCSAPSRCWTSRSASNDADTHLWKLTPPGSCLHGDRTGPDGWSLVQSCPVRRLHLVQSSHCWTGHHRLLPARPGSSGTWCLPPSLESSHSWTGHRHSTTGQPLARCQSTRARVGEHTPSLTRQRLERGRIL
jgi:hypothetical protein